MYEIEVLNELPIPFRLRVVEALRIANTHSAKIHPYCGIRGCREQAKIFRQSRRKKEIEAKMTSLHDRGFQFLADILESVGPQPGTLGNHMTKAGPGESWHQYGLALDCVPLKENKALWNNDAEEWLIYGEALDIAGLTWAGNWKGFRELPHCQLHRVNNPLTYYKTSEVALEALTFIDSITR